MLRQPLCIRRCRAAVSNTPQGPVARALPRKALLKRAQAMADRDDAMDVGAIEDDALNDDDEQDENGDEVEEGYKMV